MANKNKKEIKVDIILPNYNSSDFIKETVNSVIKQSYKNWELIFWDNQSTDDSELIIKKYLDYPVVIKPVNEGSSLDVFICDNKLSLKKKLKKMQNEFCYLSGEDGTALAYLAQGGHGCISVTANVAPKLCSEMHIAWQESNITKAQEINLKLSSLHNSLFIESSPGPVKYAASLLGLCNEDTRLPLSEIKDDTKKIVESCLQELQLL